MSYQSPIYKLYAPEYNKKLFDQIKQKISKENWLPVRAIILGISVEAPLYPFSEEEYIYGGANHFCGFRAAISLMNSSIYKAFGGDSADSMAERSLLQARDQNVIEIGQKFLEIGSILLQNDNSGVKAMEEVVKRLKEKFHNLEFQKGVEASQEIFMAYINAIGMDASENSRSRIDDYIYKGSPFIPGPYEAIVNNVVSKRKQYGLHEPMEFTLAEELQNVPKYFVPELLSKLVEIKKKFGTTPQDLSWYNLGFYAPLAMISFGYLTLFTDEDEARSKIPHPDDDRMKILFEQITNNLNYYKELLKQEPSGRTIFLHEEDQPLFSHTYYLVGVVASKINYINYAIFFGADFS